MWLGKEIKHEKRKGEKRGTLLLDTWLRTWCNWSHRILGRTRRRHNINRASLLHRTMEIWEKDHTERTMPGGYQAFTGKGGNHAVDCPRNKKATQNYNTKKCSCFRVWMGIDAERSCLAK